MAKKVQEQPDFDYKAPPQDSLFSQLEQPVENGPAEPTEAESVAEPIKPVAEIMQEHEQRQAQRARRWQELADANWPPGRIEEQLNIEFPDLKTSDQIEREDKAQDAAVRRQRRSENGPSVRPAPTRSGLGPTQLRNADEPPPHIEDARKSY